MEIFVCADLTLNKWKTTSQLLSLVEKLFNSYKNQKPPQITSGMKASQMALTRRKWGYVWREN